MVNTAILGIQWGDEGKGKIVHMLSEHSDVVCRYQGGNNAGHTVITEGKKIVLHLIPSGIIKKGKICIIGNGVVVNPYAFREELEMLKQMDIDYKGRLFVSNRANLIMPYHIELDGINEESRGIGTTKRGIGPAYTYKYARSGIRVCDLFEKEYLNRMIDLILKDVNTVLRSHGKGETEKRDILNTIEEFKEILGPFIADTTILIHDLLNKGKTVLFEGAQGALLDIDFGTYPYVTSSNPTIGGVFTGLGIGPKAVKNIIGISKAYTTRVGAGPFPTELNNETGELIREKGGEYGASTGRPRRCGWFDAVAARYGAMICGIDSIAMTKFDILDEFKTIKVCTAYEVDGKVRKDFPANVSELERAKPIYEEYPGWDKTAGVNRYEDLPDNAKRYIKILEDMIGVDISIISNGPDEKHTIIRDSNLL